VLTSQTVQDIPVNGRDYAKLIYLNSATSHVKYWFPLLVTDVDDRARIRPVLGSKLEHAHLCHRVDRNIVAGVPKTPAFMIAGSFR